METKLEHILTSTYKNEMIAYLNNHPEDFEEAINLAASDKQPYAWRAAWLLWSCMEENDIKLQGHVKKLVNVISKKGDGHQRELLKILQKMELDEEDESVLFSVCMDLWEKNNKRPSVRYTAFVFMHRMVSKYPDLLPEIKLIAGDPYLDSLTPGIKMTVSRILSSLQNE
jgi:hypothetical protein